MDPLCDRLGVARCSSASPLLKLEWRGRVAAGDERIIGIELNADFEGYRLVRQQ